MRRALAAFLLLVALADGFVISVPAQRAECFEEKARASDHVHGTWNVLIGSMLHSVHITGPGGDSVYTSEREQRGTFDYYATAEGKYRICFDNSGSDEVKEVHAKFRVGDPADLIALAKTEHLSPIEERIKSLHESMNAVRDLQDQMREQDEAQYRMTRSTRSWLLYSTLLEGFVLIAVSAWQILYLKSFFEVRRVV